MKAYTDYPFARLGDVWHEETPIRKCIVTSYDVDKYCKIVIAGCEEEVKSGYLYSKVGRCGEVSAINLESLPIIN